MSADLSKGGKGTCGLSRRGALVGAASLAGLGLTKAALAKPLAEVLSTKKLRAGIKLLHQVQGFNIGAVSGVTVSEAAIAVLHEGRSSAG